MLVQVTTLHASIRRRHVNPQVQDPTAGFLFFFECFVEVVFYSPYDIRLSSEVACVPRLILYFLRRQLLETTPVLEELVKKLN